MKIVTVVGARPQFIKAASFSRAIAEENISGGYCVHEDIIHTGQHYDQNMSDVFFQELGIPAPKYHLGVGSGSHGKQTGRMLEAIEGILLEKRPDVVLVYGDTNSTLAAALAAAKLHIPVAHVEAGLRSFNRKMPEEINRIMTDHLSDFLFCPSKLAVNNLVKEGIQQGVYNVGDIMYDSILYYQQRLSESMETIKKLGLNKHDYFLATVHRAENTDSAENLREIFSAFGELQTHHQIIIALHPRTKVFINKHSIKVPAGVRLIDPVSYLEMIELEMNARMILTDSGGVQKEAFFVRTPCLTLREETEWVETVELGCNKICSTSKKRIIEGFESFSDIGSIPGFDQSPYGDGRSARMMLQNIIDGLSTGEILGRS